MSHTLLLADDSVTVQRVIELTFADEGFKVVSFGDGDEVVGYLESGSTPDVILADTTMPARDGYDVAAWVKGRDTLRAVPVVLMTGAFEPIDDARAQACQADAILVKPFEPQQVVSLVKRMLSGERGVMLGEFAPPQGTTAPAQAGDAVVTLAPGLDTYAQRLDDHLAARQRRPMLADMPEPSELTVETRDSPGALDGAERPAVRSLADTFAAVLAAERGEAAAPDFGTAPALSPALIDAVAERVAGRLSDAVLREVVAKHVIDVAERLVSAEIDKIKSGLA